MMPFRVSWRAYRIRHVDMPATPVRIWAAIAEGRRPCKFTKS